MGIPVTELCRLLTVFKYINNNNTLAQLLLLISLQLNGQYQTMTCVNFGSVCKGTKIVFQLEQLRYNNS